MLEQIQSSTERFLTWYKRRRVRKLEKRSKVPAVLEWIYTFLWAICIILVLNQYLFQFYVIPSGSMEDTLLIHDRISVNKLIFGPELLPGILKMPGFAKPQHGDIITFKNPDYKSKGPLFDIVQRFVFMLTLSLVNLDRNKNGGPAIHYLIKRVIATGGDRIKINPSDGSMMLKPAGTDRWITEKTFKELAGLHYRTIRLFDRADYRLLLRATRAYVRYNAGLPVTRADIEAANRMPSFYDFKVYEDYRDRLGYEIQPQNHVVGGRWRSFENGWYIPKNYYFPMGDNRDNSHDGRYFGPIPLRIVLGKATFRFWPPDRIGSLYQQK